MKNTSFALLFSAVFALGLASCGDSNSNEVTPVVAPEATMDSVTNATTDTVSKASDAKESAAEAKTEKTAQGSNKKK